MIITNYTNGNINVEIHDDGTKIRDFYGIPQPEFPESIDIKITDYCDMGCRYCHESSTISGLHGNLDHLLKKLSILPKGIELAIGGGNPLSHSDLIHFLTEANAVGFIPNITVNQGHLKVYQDLLQDLIHNNLIYGLGISITSLNISYIKPLLDATPNIVFHMIAGVTPVEYIDYYLLGKYCKVLVLGYKQYGFGRTYYSPEVRQNLDKWKWFIPRYLSKCTLSFDNLSIEQLHVKRLLSETKWEEFYMGEDFSHTMYIDAVKQEFAQTSRSEDRTSWKDTSIIDYFKKR